MIAGVDFSSKKLDLVRRHDGGVDATWRQIKLTPQMEAAEKDAVIAREIGAIMLEHAGWWDDVWLCGIEYPFTNAKFIGSVILKTVMGAIIGTIPPHVHVLALPARVWTPWFLRERLSDPLPKVPHKGVDRKPLIKAHALRLLGSDDIWPQDAYDAFGISVAVERYNLPATDGFVQPTRPVPRAARAR